MGYMDVWGFKVLSNRM